MKTFPHYTIEKILRIPKRVREAFSAIVLIKNWRSFLSAKYSKKTLKKIYLRNGVVLSAPPQTDLDFLFQEIWIDKTYSPKGYQITSNDVIIDIGANIGVFSLYAATCASQTRIYAFEPFPENINYFQQNVSDSRIENIKLEGKAVAKKPDQRTLQITESGITHKLKEQENSIAGVLVECTTLDEILNKTSRCDLLKIDCEGSEYEILYSCDPENLKKIKKIVGEYHYRDDQQKNGKALKEFLEKHSFRVDHFTAFNDEVGLICATKKGN